MKLGIIDYYCMRLEGTSEIQANDFLSGRLKENWWLRKEKREKKNDIVIPIPGVEPGPPGWKPGILTARPYGNYMVW